MPDSVEGYEEEMNESETNQAVEVNGKLMRRI
jgi:hypothetical protein